MITQFDDISDIHLCVSDPSNSVVFADPARADLMRWPQLLPPMMLDQALSLLQLCQNQQESSLREDFMIAYGDFRFRARLCQQGLDGWWFRLRKMQQETAFLNSLPTPLPEYLTTLMMSPELSTMGGLIFVLGAPGSGKTTTASGIVATRLSMLGGFGYTVEDPPEMPLNGWYRYENPDDPTDVVQGYCSQNTVNNRSPDPWGEAIREALRSQPTGSSRILYIGEVRDKFCARALLKAASDGFLVIATGFGQDVINGLDGLLRLAGQAGGDPEALNNDLANCLRLAVHQTINPQGYLDLEVLTSTLPTGRVANAIRSNGIGRLKSIILEQRNQGKNNYKLVFGRDDQE